MGRGQPSHGRADFGLGGSTSSRGFSVRDLDVGLDEYTRGRRPATGLHFKRTLSYLLFRGVVA